MGKTFPDLIEDISEFTLTRGFDKTDTPKNLAMALCVEASEILEIFQWLNDGEIGELTTSQLLHAKSEIADVLIYLIALSERLRINLLDSAFEKMEINAVKYPSLGK